MARLVTITPSPVKVPSGSTYSNLYSAIDVSAFDELFLLAQVLSIETPSSPSANINLITGMQTHTNDGWVTAATFSINAVGTWQTQLSKGTFLRFVRWYVTSATGMTNMTIWVSGVGRTFNTAA